MMNPLSEILPSSDAPADKLSHAFGNVSRAIGFVTIALPVGCLLAALISFVPPEDIQNSISHFYYTPIMGDFFVGCLFFNGILLMFMFHTNGKPVHGWKRLSLVESFLMRLTGFAALMIALFPTSGPSDSYGKQELLRVFVSGENGNTALFGIESLGWIATWHLHKWFALIMFVNLAYFTAFVFTRDHTTDLGTPQTPPSANKLRRNRYYRILGAAIIVSVALIGLAQFDCVIPSAAWSKMNGTFIFEGVALLSFGLAWLIKGRFFQSLNG